MPAMYPTMVGDSNDSNRRPSGQEGSGWPNALRTAYWCALGCAVAMLLTGMMLLAAGFPEGADEQLRGAFMTNMRITAFGNMALALGLVVAVTQLPARSKRARGWATGACAVAIFLNLAGFVVGVASWASFAIVVALTVTVFFLFRPESTRYLEGE